MPVKLCHRVYVANCTAANAARFQSSDTDESATITSSPFCGRPAEPLRFQLAAKPTSDGDELAVVAVNVQVAPPAFDLLRVKGVPGTEAVAVIVVVVGEAQVISVNSGMVDACKRANQPAVAVVVLVSVPV